MKKAAYIFFQVVLFFSCGSSGLQPSSAGNPEGFTILFWNLENLFDTHDDPMTEDEEFTPGGLRNWDNYRYYLKIRAVWKTILAAGAGRPPEIIAVCEIENRKTLEDLFIHSPFGRYDYRIIHHDSPDPRGIDCALIYDTILFKVARESFIQPVFTDPDGHPTRDILYALLRTGKDSLHLFVNHWPSKYGGAGYTEPYRRSAAQTLRDLTDSLFRTCRDPRIICTGDFNDTPESVSISDILLAPREENVRAGSKLIRIPPVMEKVEGTIRYQGHWQCIDHFFVSEGFFRAHHGLSAGDSSVTVYSPGFLLEEDNTYGGIKPYRTWTGVRYNGGVSDHLPVVMRVRRRQDTGCFASLH